jgi:hypothetical protein
VTEDLEDLLNLLLSTEDRRQLVLPGHEVQIGGELLQIRRELKPLLQALMA